MPVDESNPVKTRAMNNRPIPVTIIGWIYVVTGVVAFAVHAMNFKGTHPFEWDIVWACLTALLAIVAGAFMLRGCNWARWLAVFWIAGHIILSLFHPLSELIVHAALFAVITTFLFLPSASAYFRGVIIGAEHEQEEPEVSSGP